MSRDHIFTMTDRQQKRYKVDEYNRKYEENRVAREARQKQSLGGQFVLAGQPDDNTPPDTVVVKLDEKEIPAVENTQSDGSKRRVVVFGAGGVTPAGRFASRMMRDSALVRAVELIQEKETPNTLVTMATPEVLGDLAKQQAREDICQLLIDEGDDKKFTDYVATLAGINPTDMPLRRLKLRSLADVDPKEIMTYVDMYRRVIQEVYGVDENGEAIQR